MLATTAEASPIPAPVDRPQLNPKPDPAKTPGLFLMTTSGDTGGTERQFAIMADVLGHGPFRVETGCIHRRGSFFSKLPEIHEFSLGGSFASWHAVRSFAGLVRYLRRNKIAVAHSFDFYTNLMLLPAARLAGTPVVIGSMRQLGDRLSLAQTKALAWVLRKVPDRIVCNSRAAANRLGQLGVGADKLVVIPNALPEECFDRVLPVLPRKGSVLRVGMIARMNEKVKNHPAVLRATACLVREFPEIELVLAGDGKLRPELEKMAADLGIASQVCFLGECRDVPPVLASLDVCVLTSTSESMPNAILEAMAAGLPVVATRVGGSPELVQHGETGFLVDSGHDEQLVAALRTLLQEEPVRKQFGLRGREVARASFGVAIIQKQYEDLYTAVLQEKRAAGKLRGSDLG